MSFGQSIDFVVEQDDVQIYVSADGMNKMVSADGKGITVSGYFPNCQFRIGAFYPRGNGCRPAVNGMKPEGTHVIGEAGRTSDSGDNGEIFVANAQIGHRFLDGIQYGVVAASRTPSDFAFAFEVLERIVQCILHDYSSISFKN